MLFPLSKLLKWLRSIDTIEIDSYINDISRLEAPSWQQEPFPYLVIDDFFSEEYALELRSSFLSELERRGVNDTKRDPEKFSRMHNYDAYNFSPIPNLEESFRVFYSRDWHTLFKKLSGLPFDENVMTALHHHKVGSSTGYIHSDFGTYAFRYNPLENELNHWRRNSRYQVYEAGEDLATQGNATLTRRSFVLIYYLDHPKWHEGDGGETAFFIDPNAPPVTKIAPRPNRLLAFPIHKQSLHCFLKNHSFERNTVIQWFHEPISSIDARLKIE